MSNPQPEMNRAKFYQLALFPMNNGATNVYFVLILSYIATFGNKVLGIAMVFASVMVTGMRVFDAITDPIIGALMDKTNGKFGKFRPFMVIGNAVMALAVFLLYMVTPMIPASMAWARYAAFVGLYAVWVIGYTFQTSVTRAAQPVLTNDPKQRPLFTIFNTIGSLAGMGVMQALGPIMAGDGFAGDYNSTWFAIMTPIGIVVSVLLTVLAIVGIWEKDNSKYFGLGEEKTEAVKISEYVSIVKSNKPLQRLMVAGGGCKLALSIATNVTVLCMIYGCMTQFGMGVNQGVLSGIDVNNKNAITNLQLEEGDQVLGLTFDSPILEPSVDDKGEPVTNDAGEPLYKFNNKATIANIQISTAGEMLLSDGKLQAAAPVDAVVWYIDEGGNPGDLALDENGGLEGLVFNGDGSVLGLNVNQSGRVMGLLVNEDGMVIQPGTNKALELTVGENGVISGLSSTDTVKLVGRNGYDSLYLIMMVLGYVFAVPFFVLTVQTSQKKGQKASLMTYVAVALACYVGVFVLMLLWKFGNPAWNLSIFEGALFGSDFKITINLYTILFILFFGVGYGAYYATADMPIPMVADCADYETYRSGKFIPGIMGTLFSLVDKLVSSLSATVVAIALGFIYVNELPTKATPFVDGMNWVSIALFCGVPMVAWALTLIAMRGYELDGNRIKTIQAVNAARKQAIAKGMSMEEAMATITDETVAQ